MKTERRPSAPAPAPAPRIAELFRLLHQRNRTPGERRRIDAEIQRRFRTTRAVLVLDMAGFSVSVQRHGIVHHLGLICHMRRRVHQHVTAAGGQTLKFEADNALAVFRTVPAALRAALAINRSFAEDNQSAAEENRIHASIGIGYGPVLLARDDVFGDEVNLASKLGEDIAKSDEVLVTASAHRRAGVRAGQFESLDISIAGIHLAAFRWQPDA